MTQPSPTRILLVDDNVDASTLLSMLLEMSGYEVAVAVDGAQGLAAFERERPRIVVCDIGLPGMNGHEVARRIRQGEAAGGDPALLIALTGYDAPEDRQRALAAGFDHHLGKPFEFDDLLVLLPKA